MNSNSSKTLKNRLLLARVLTRSGDQAWDFAVPLAILQIFPGELRLASLYYLILRVADVLILPSLAKTIDRVHRITAMRLGVIIQFVGVLVGFSTLEFISRQNSFYTPFNIILLIVFLIGGILSSLGTTFMDISVANDLVPEALDDDELSAFNSRLRQVDLATEFGAPILAGWLLAVEGSNFTLFGLMLVASWNLFSFFPEYYIYNLIFKSNSTLSHKQVQSNSSKKNPFKELKRGWNKFLKDRISLVAISYACLWLSVLSPHGVLLTGFLKDGWSLSEWEIGLFRGLGGFFGLAATLSFPKVKEKIGLIRSSQIFLAFQLFMVVLSLLFFFYGEGWSKYLFMVFILFSRIGLYGFSLGEMQIRQEKIKPNVRGEFNGFASAMTSIATLGLYGGGALLPKTGDFNILVTVSGVMVFIGLTFFSFWKMGEPKN